MRLAGILDGEIVQAELRLHALQELGARLPQSDPHDVARPLRPFARFFDGDVFDAASAGVNAGSHDAGFALGRRRSRRLSCGVHSFSGAVRLPYTQKYSPFAISCRLLGCRRPARARGASTSTAFYGQLFDRPEAWPLAQADLVGRHRQAQSRPTGEQRLQGAHAFDACKLMAEAEMDPGPEGDVPVRPSLEAEPFGMLVRQGIHVGGRQQANDFIALLQPTAAKLRVLAHDPGLGTLHRREEAQELLDRETRPTPILLEPIPQRGIPD